MSSFLAEANTSKSAVATTPPSSIVPENSYYDGLPLFVDYQTSARKFAFVSSANYPFIQISVKTLTNLQLILQQAVNNVVDEFDEPVNPVGNNYVIVPAMNVAGNPALLNYDIPSEMLYFQVTSPFFRLVVVNQSATQLGQILLTTKLASTRPSNALVQKDSVLIAGINPTSQPTALRTDEEGRLKVDAAVTIESITLSPDNDGVRVYGGVGGTNDYKLLNTDSTGKLDIVGATECIGNAGNYVVYATPDNNTPAVAADGVAPINVPGGWKYLNTGNGTKINWYSYANDVNQAPTAKKVNQVKNMYMVLNQQASAVETKLNPYIVFYTLPDAGVNAGGTFFKSRIVFNNDLLNSSVVGNKLLYFGEDNQLIHPEITTRVELIFNPVVSTKTLLQAGEELLYLSSIHSDSSASAGQYNFVLSEFGQIYTEEGLKYDILPIINKRVQVELGPSSTITGSVAVSNFPATQPVSGTIAVSNFPSVQDISGNVSVSNLTTIETSLDDVNANLDFINTNTAYFLQPPTKYALIDTPTTLTAYNVVTNSTLPLKANALSNILYRNAIYIGEVDASTFTNPQLIFEYSDDEINWFSDGVSASFNKRGANWTFAFQRSSIGVAYVRLVAQNTTRITYAVANLSM
jgi:hypothetical protein